MSSTPKVQTHYLLQWAKDGGLLAITGTGIVLYIFLSIPAVIFYGRLGVSAGDVGLTYSGLLSGSTLEIAGGLIILTGIILVFAFYAGTVTLFLRFALPYARYKRRERKAGGWKSGVELTDEKFEERMAVYQSFLTRFPEVVNMGDPSSRMTVEEVINHDRRVRTLRRLGVLDEQQDAELNALKEQAAALRRGRAKMSPFGWPAAVTRNWLNRSGRFVAASFLILVIVVLLPVTAYVQAGDVLHGRLYTASSAGIFDYRASLVRVAPASADPPQSVSSLEGRTFFLLGQNAQDVILYSRATRSTIRIPSDSVIITTVQK